MNLDQLMGQLRPHDPVDVLATLGALQLVPQNAERILRCEALALAATMCDGPSKPRPFLSTKVKQVCNDVGAKERQLEDPAENMFTDVVTYHGGSYIVFPGIAENPAYNLQVLARALIAPKRSYADSRFPEVSTHLIGAVLRLSDAIARRAGLQRYIPPRGSEGKVVVPADGELERLKSAVTWTRADLEGLLVGTPMWVIESLVQSASPPTGGSYSHERNPLHAFPIVRRGEVYVVPVPSLLTWAAMNRVLGAATKAGEIVTLADNVADASWIGLDETCGMLGMTPLENAMDPPLSIDGAREGFFRIDTDKVAYVLLVCDHLKDYDDTEPAAFMPDDTRAPLLNERIQNALDHAYSFGDVNSVLVLVSSQVLTRAVATPFERISEDGEPLMLGMPVADLRTIAILEPGKALHLWKFARAAQAARKRLRVSVFNPLDEYGFYRDQDFSYYASDKERPNFLSISTGYIKSLREEAALKIDRHAVPAPVRGQIVEVLALQPDVPIYFITSDLGKPIRRFVEGSVAAWVVPEGEAEVGPVLHMFADAVAYWLWQAQGPFAAALEGVASRSASDPLLVRVRAAAGQGWTDNEAALADASPPFVLKPKPREFEIEIEFNPSSAELFHGPTNEGERRLVGELAKALAEVGERTLSAGEVASLTDVIAPLGPKKRILIFQTGESQLGHPEGLPAPRPLDRADQQRLLDEVGETLGTRYPVGVLPPDHAQSLVNDAVEWFYQRMRALVAQLDPNGLLESLLLSHEGLLADQSLMESTIAAQLACFGDNAKMREGLIETAHRFTSTAVAHRFLIEYVAARPPRGIRPLSYGVLDELLALGEKIITYGFDSDLLFFRLAPAEFGMLPSGRLGRSTTFDEARNEYMRILTSRAISAQASRFEKAWTAPENHAAPPPDISKLDAATSIEFGLPLTKLRAVFSELLNATLDIPNGIFREREKDLRDRLRAKCGLTDAEAAAALDLLSLGPRADFFNVPPYKAREVYPWKYNRAMSYLRRPILIEDEPDSGAKWAVWGRRHTYKAAHYLGDLIFGGRLQARTPAMKEWLGGEAKERGAEFERETIKMLARRGYEVKPSVKKIPSELGRLISPGDIDALVVDRKRKRLVLVECKDISIARTPAEIANEIERLTQDAPGKRSIMTKHLARLEWAKANLEHILKWLGEPPDKRWQVLAWFVTDEHLFASNLTRLPIPVVAFEDVERSGLR